MISLLGNYPKKSIQQHKNTYYIYKDFLPAFYWRYNNLKAWTEIDNLSYIILLKYPEFFGISFEDSGAAWQCLQDMNKKK